MNKKLKKYKTVVKLVLWNDLAEKSHKVQEFDTVEEAIDYLRSLEKGGRLKLSYNHTIHLFKKNVMLATISPKIVKT